MGEPLQLNGVVQVAVSLDLAVGSRVIKDVLGPDGAPTIGPAALFCQGLEVNYSSNIPDRVKEVEKAFAAWIEKFPFERV